MSAEELANRRPRQADVGAIIGLLATVEGELMPFYDHDDAIPEWADYIAQRLSADGLLAPGAGNRELRQSLNDLNHRMRYVYGDYGEPPVPRPVA